MALLETFGLDFTAEGADVDETPGPAETAAAMVTRLAATKARAALAESRQLVLGADTTVAVDGVPFGKPASAEEGVAMLLELSGRTHEVLTGIALATVDGVTTDMSRTLVEFRDLRPDEALAYWQSGEPRDKAGGYAIQGLGALFVRRIEGSYTGVVGLPMFETARLLERAGLEVLARFSSNRV